MNTTTTRSTPRSQLIQTCIPLFFSLAVMRLYNDVGGTGSGQLQAKMARREHRAIRMQHCVIIYRYLLQKTTTSSSSSNSNGKVV